MSDPILLTPGPLTTSAVTRAALLRDWGSWDRPFNELTASVCERLVEIAGGSGTHECVPMQGSGTFAVEAALGTLVPRGARVLVPSNGAYCERITRILGVLNRDALALRFDECAPVDADRIEQALVADPTVTHVALVHCETGTGVLNPLPAVAKACARHGRRLIVDAMSSFGALPIDLRDTPIDALVSASGKCLEGVPGMGFVIALRAQLERAEGRAHSLALDLHDQWRYLCRTGQWRFTPPTHVVAALAAALVQYQGEGGQPARLARYEANRARLVEGMRRLGFRTLLDDAVQSPIIVTFLSPNRPEWNWPEFYRRVRDRGFVLYPGKLTQADTFRVGCIGAIGTAEVDGMLAAVEATLLEMGLRLADGGPPGGLR